MEVAKISAKKRTQTGRNALTRLRLGGELPAVIYGEAAPNHSLSLDARQMDRLFRTHHRVFELDLDDGTKEEAFLHQVQLDPIQDHILHVDFLRVNLKKPIQAEVPLEFLGHPVGLIRGGKFDHDLADLLVECLPTQLPEKIEVAIKDLDLNQHITAGQLVLPEGVKLAIPPETVVCHVKVFYEAAATPAEGEVAEPTSPELIRKAKEDEGGEGKSE
jgi:large subunit ribosomal protein L25